MLRETFKLGDIVATDYGDGIVIDITEHNEVQVAFDDGVDIYYPDEEVVKLNSEDAKHAAIKHKFRKEIKSMLKAKNKGFMERKIMENKIDLLTCIEADVKKAARGIKFAYKYNIPIISEWMRRRIWKKIFKIVDAEVNAQIEKTFDNFSEFVDDSLKN